MATLAFTWTEMGCCSLSIWRMDQKVVNLRLDQQMMISLTHKKKISIMMTITMTTRKNMRFGKMVRRCTLTFPLNFCTHLITGEKSDFACNAALPTDMMVRRLHRPPLYSPPRRKVRCAHFQASINTYLGLPFHTEGLEATERWETEALAMALEETTTATSGFGTAEGECTTPKAGSAAAKVASGRVGVFKLTTVSSVTRKGLREATVAARWGRPGPA
jgi:hypothetical protein